MPSHARTRSIGSHPHQGATSRRLPRRVNPRLTSTFAGIRCTERARTVTQMILGGATMVTLCDWDNDPTVWVPLAARILGLV